MGGSDAGHRDSDLDATARAACRRWPGRPRRLEELSGRADQPQCQGDHARRRLRGPLQRPGSEPARHRPGQRVLQQPGRRTGRRRCARDRLSAGPRHPAGRLPRGRHPDQRRHAGPGVLARVATGCRSAARRAAVPRPLRHVRAAARLPEGRQDNGFRLPDRLPATSPATFGEIRRVLRATDQTTVPCNNDLLAATSSTTANGCG